MKKPNFFIIGAPKCGTTSLAAWLSEHPQVFMSPVKEPHFFDYDAQVRWTSSLEDYEQLFSEATEAHIAVGEASVLYLHSRVAVPAIIDYVDKPKFIVMVRNPVEMAYSLHDQVLFNCDEDENDFERAWELQERRMVGEMIPKSCFDSQRLFYGPRCRLGEQLQRLYETVPRERVLVINLETIKVNTFEEYRRVLSFLGVGDDGRDDFPVRNSAKERRFASMWRSLRWAHRSLRAMGGPHIRVGAIQSLFMAQRRERPRPPMSDAMRRRLQEYFADDIELLEELTQWDLSHWKSEHNDMKEQVSADRVT